ncbi:methylated-DNA--protein-cysteine methyltransferase [Methanoregula boonei 6A8]|uniref:Methylated-DNA--protein-cysteine methyltransferase n=1 Tax=Methanoregula boonei (strain DSM 21154 / JCM 14090 / 6A8) TaxID=456442 RepID=A7I7C3_METB6|nr:methylated-DNA--[protein]-cysteine S-methyltransferase [Methanoregula boonei]ABS55634.1 methylated-DNA--protein-cysteine methyltransferase [Methanoregula boonei 6A8]
MEVTGGSCRLGLWHVHVWWSGDTIHRVRFAPTGIPGPVPAPIQKYCAGRLMDLSGLRTVACEGDTVSSLIYRAVREIPYGSTATYGDIARIVGTSPRAVGRAMAHNPTPLVVPCHRVVAANGIGGFTPAPEIKEHLLLLEKKAKKRQAHQSG